MKSEINTTSGNNGVTQLPVSPPFATPEKKSTRGGARPGGGRKSAKDEMAIRRLFQSAIVKEFGSLREGIEALLKTRDPYLMKWVFERFFGKPAERIDMSNIQKLSKLTIEVIEGNQAGNGTTEDTEHSSIPVISE